MKFSSLSLAAGLIATSSAVKVPHKRDVSTVQFDIQRRDLSGVSRSARDKLRKRDGTLQITLDNLETLYFANVSMGTPPQPLRLDIDTGSSDLWANAKTSSLCTSGHQASQCQQSGTYSANDSSTYSYVNSDFLIQYADNSGAQGDYAKDTLTVGGTAIPDVQFGIGYQSTSYQGILGVGYASNEAEFGTVGQTYNNFPLVLVGSGVIASPAYSLWLNDLDANSGSILFGGIDTDKFTGNLGTLPIIPERGVYAEFIVSLTGLTASGQTIVSSPLDVLLDSGSSLSYLPTSYAQAVFNIFKAQYSQSDQVAVVNCKYANTDGNFTFNFGDLAISVPFNEMVIPENPGAANEQCILGITDAGSSTAVLGDTFLRSAYVVYDMANNEISMAQTHFNATASNVEAIASGTAGVPSASAVTGAVSTGSVTSGGARIPSTTSIPTGSSSHSAAPGQYARLPSLGAFCIAAVSLLAGAMMIAA